jgi:hypothetical protein
MHIAKYSQPNRMQIIGEWGKPLIHSLSRKDVVLDDLEFSSFITIPVHGVEDLCSILELYMLRKSDPLPQICFFLVLAFLLCDNVF